MRGKTQVFCKVSAVLFTALVTLSVMTPAKCAEAENLDAYAIGVDAYTYLYPLVLMEVTRRQATNVEAGKTVGRGPMNTFVHVREYPPGDFKDVVRPNFDTLYSAAWLDLTSGPILMSVPDTGDRYYLLPMLDMWTDVFAVVGTRTTGNWPGRYLVVPPGWKGPAPAGAQPIYAPTPYVWIVGRTQTNGPADYAAVHAVQDQMTLSPTEGTEQKPFVADPVVDMKTPPLFQVANMTPELYFETAFAAMAVNPPHPTDQPIIAQMRRIGLEVGKPLNWPSVAPHIRTELERGAKNALARIRASYDANEASPTGWKVRTTNTGVFGTNYLNRASVAMFGLGANLPEDAIYPNRDADSQGDPLIGDKAYQLRFEKGQLPPVTAFWSLTLYDKNGFPVANPLKRYALGDRDPLQFGEDGSLTIYIQHDSPPKEFQANWLPAPVGEFLLQMRLYGPKAEALDGSWMTPQLITTMGARGPQ